MAKPNSMFYCSLHGGESFDEFAHLGSLREVMEHMQDEELRHLLRRCREGGRQDWPVDAMLNAYYAMIVLQYRSIESLRRNLAADTRYELPFDFRVESASVSETPVCREMMSEILSNAEAGARCVDFVADRGLDDDQLRRQLHERGVTPFIETRRMWKDEPLGDIRKPTRALCEDRVDTMVYTECGKVYCVCPQSGEVRPMFYAGFEKKRQTLKYRCPAVEYGLHCAGRDECHRMGGISPNAKQRIVRIKFNDGKHPMRTFGPCPRNTRKWKQTFDRRNSLERINARVGRDFQLDDHFLRGKSAMHLRIAGSMAVMLAIALGCLEKNKPDKMRSLVTPLAACNPLAVSFLTMLPEAAGTGTSETRKSPKIRCFAARKSSDKAPNSPTRTFSCHSRPRGINNFVLNFFPTGNSVKEKTCISKLLLCILINSPRFEFG